MARQMSDVVYDLRGQRCEVAAYCEEREIENLRFTADGLPSYAGHDQTGVLVTFMTDPTPVVEPTSISKYRFGLA